MTDRRLRVLVNALAARPGGGLTYVCQQLEALRRVRPAWDISVLTAPWNERSVESTGVKVRTVPLTWLAARVAYEQVTVPVKFRRDLDAIYCPGNFAPLASRVPCVVAEQNAHYFGPGRLTKPGRAARTRIEARLAALSMRRAQAVVAISRSLSDAMDLDGLPRHNRTVILSGAPTDLGVSEHPPRIDPGVSFFLVLASDNPHKRLDDIVQAWSVLEGAGMLIVAGKVAADRRQRLRELASARRSSLSLLGLVSDRAHVAWLLENASALVIASELEAFPLTPIEAGSVGCPLILSDIPPHREVAGEHAMYFPTGDIDGLRELMRRTIQDPPGREPWRWPVSWDENAEQLALVIERVARKSGAS